MKSLNSKLAVWIGLFAVCLMPMAAAAAGPSGVVGLVEEGSLRGWTVSVSADNNTFITSVHTDQDGFFRLNLKPGNYVLTPFYVPHPGRGQPVPNFVVMGPSKSVRVANQHFVFVVLNGGFD